MYPGQKCPGPIEAPCLSAVAACLVRRIPGRNARAQLKRDPGGWLGRRVDTYPGQKCPGPIEACSLLRGFFFHVLVSRAEMPGPN